MATSRTWAGALAIALVGAACGDSPTGPSPEPGIVDLSRPWATATVAEGGGSPDRVARGLAEARANPRLTSLLVVRDGRLVVEEYFRGRGPESLHDIRSVTKSVVSALTGLALSQGHLRSLDESIATYLEPDVSLTPEQRKITVRHLLTMTSGFAWDESGGLGDYNDWVGSSDPVGYLLARPPASPPGAAFEYNSAAVHLLGIVLERATGTSLPTFARRSLFGPMGIDEAPWEAFPDGSVNGGSGIDLRARDLARFGQLYLQEGRSGVRQVLPAEWTRSSTAAGFEWRASVGSLEGISYGMLWWTVPDAPDPFHFAWGYGGQYVVVVPGKRLVVVATNDWQGMSGDGGARLYERATMDVIVEYILPAFGG